MPRPAVGDAVRLRYPKAGLLKHDDVGLVIEDDGADAVPLKVRVGVAHDWYNAEDLDVCEAAVEGGSESAINSAFTAPSRYCNSGVFAHGTKFKNFHSIMQEGLKAAKSDIFMINELRSDGRVPGLDKAPEILIFIDEAKARSENMDFFYDPQSGTWRTSGINGVVRPWFFQKVVDQRKGPSRGKVIFQSKEDPVMHANLLKGARRPRYLLHATYWENVSGIMTEGIVPAKNPTSSVRRPLEDLLRDAESCVHTVSVNGFPASGFDLRGVQSLRSSPPQRGQTCDVQAPQAETAGPAWKVLPEDVGLESRPDAFFVIDTQRAEELNIPLNLVQSDWQDADCQDTVFVQGPVPPELLVKVEPNEPVSLPDDLKASIIDPRSFDKVPIIDLRQDEATVISDLKYACEVCGFMQLVGHGVSTELQERHMDFQRRFFALPQEVKGRLKLSDSCPVRGYFGPGGEDLDNVLLEKVDSAGGEKIVSQSRKDRKEALDCNGVSWSVPSGGFVAEIFGKASRLPEEEELPGFRDCLEEYSKSMFDLAKRLLSLMALVLGKPRDFFEAFLTAPVATHRLLHYWPITDFKTQVGVGEHTDYGLLTILKQDAVGGLQVLNYKDSKWIHAVPIPDAFVVNLGDMMGRWTAHRFKSTVHRVVNTSPNERYSVPFFVEPNMDTVIRYGALCDDAAVQGDAANRESGTAEEILERFYRASGQLKVRGVASKAGVA